MFLLFISYVKAQRVVDASLTCRVCVCLLQWLPKADFGQNKVEAPHPALSPFLNLIANPHTDWVKLEIATIKFGDKMTASACTVRHRYFHSAIFFHPLVLVSQYY